VFCSAILDDLTARLKIKPGGNMSRPSKIYACGTTGAPHVSCPVRTPPWDFGLGGGFVFCQCSLVIFCRCFILCSWQSWSRQFCYWARANHRTVANRCRIIMIGVSNARCYQLVRCWLLMNECKTLNVDFVTFVYRRRWCRFLFFSALTTHTNTNTTNNNDNNNDTFQHPYRYQQ